MSRSHVVKHRMEVWQQWKIAQQTSGRLSQVHHPNHKWVKPAAGFMKRNVNASILAQRSAIRKIVLDY
ncbi:hypothetical protein NC652_019018 [Populus alba x Populus x berolinensis]|nr:hypothetical protein NC652_019018 [Populus alba x Populus x berolinensis]